MGKMSVNGVIGSEYLFHRLLVEERIAEEEEVEVAVEGEGRGRGRDYRAGEEVEDMETSADDEENLDAALASRKREVMEVDGEVWWQSR
jgi:hypothetical protein